MEGALIWTAVDIGGATAVWVLTSLLVRSGDARRSQARVARLGDFPTLSML